VVPVPDPLLRKSGGAGNQTWDRKETIETKKNESPFLETMKISKKLAMILVMIIMMVISE
jgi:hypothetical protein